MKKLEILGKRWVQKTYGNTYFSAIALLNGKEIARIDFEYGYGNQWLYEICKKIVIDQYSIGDRQVPWRFIEFLEDELDIAVFTNCEDVSRKSDLKFLI